MDAIGYRTLATGLPILGLVALGAIALWSVRELLSDRLRARRDRPIAILLGLGIGLALGGIVLVLVVGLASMDSGSPGLDAYLRFLPIGLLFAAPVVVAAVAGYAVLARTRLAPVALVGTVLGTVLVVGIAAGGSMVVGWANSRTVDLATDREAAALAARSSVLTLSVSDVRVLTAADGTTVRQVRMHVSVDAAQDVQLSTGGKSAWPRFSIRQDDVHPILDAPTPAGPATLAAGSSTPYDLTFEAPQLSDGGPSRIILVSTWVEPTVGTWLLTMQLEDEAGQRYEVTAPVVIGAAP